MKIVSPCIRNKLCSIISRIFFAFFYTSLLLICTDMKVLNYIVFPHWISICWAFLNLPFTHNICSRLLRLTRHKAINLFNAMGSSISWNKETFGCAQHLNPLLQWGTWEWFRQGMKFDKQLQLACLLILPFLSSEWESRECVEMRETDHTCRAEKRNLRTFHEDIIPITHLDGEYSLLIETHGIYNSFFGRYCIKPDMRTYHRYWWCNIFLCLEITLLDVHGHVGCAVVKERRVVGPAKPTLNAKVGSNRGHFSELLRPFSDCGFTFCTQRWIDRQIQTSGALRPSRCNVIKHCTECKQTWSRKHSSFTYTFHIERSKLSYYSRIFKWCPPDEQ